MKQRCNILSLFPEVIESYLSIGVIGRAIERELIEMNYVNFRDFAKGKYRAVDDVPFGGGAGMVIQAEPVAQALDQLADQERIGHVILTAPHGKVFTQRDAERLSTEPTLTFICGRYEGIDARVNLEYVDEVFSIGDYVLSGGELAAMVMIDSLARLRPGALGNEQSARHESYSLTSDLLLEHPHYTRPASW
jgi:tRNA (guanine37-N1)-methyltransferase